MPIATFDHGRMGVVGSDETVVAISDLLERYEPLGPGDFLPDLITHFGGLKMDLDNRIAAGGGIPLR